MSKNTHKTQLWQQIVFGVQIQVIFGFSSIMPDVIGNFVEGDSNSVEGAAHQQQHHELPMPQTCWGL